MDRKRLFALMLILSIALTPVLQACQPSPPVTATAPPPVIPAPAVTNVPGAPTVPPATAAPAPATAVPTAVEPQRGNWQPEKLPEYPPNLLRATPEAGAEQKPDAPVILTFDRPLDEATARQAFSITPDVPGDVQVRGQREIVFTPRDRLPLASRFRVTVDTRARGANGLALAEPVTVSFQTAGFLEVTGAQPADGTRDVPADGKIVVSFNRPVVPLGAIQGPAQPLVITPTVTGEGEWLSTSVYQLTPERGLAASTSYSVTVRAGLADTTGGVLRAPFTFGFRTTDPDVLQWAAITRGQAHVTVDSPITVTFTLPMERASTEAAFTLMRDGNERVAGSFAWGKEDKSLSFKPAEPLRQGSRYEAAIAQTARPAVGEGTLRRTSSYRFQVLPKPAVVRSTPANGDRAADPQAPVTINFAGPLDQNSLGADAVTVLPKPTSTVTGYNEFDGNFYLYFDKLPNQTYTVTVSGKIADPYGNRLGNDVVIRFTTRDYSPIIQFASQASHVTAYSAYTSTFAAVTNRNIEEVGFQLYRVPERDFITLTGVNYWDAWSRYQPAERDLVRAWSERPQTPRNETGTLTTPLVQRNGQQLPTGMYFLSMWRRTGQADALAGKQLIVRTDLNLVLKVSETSALVWATDLKSGMPVAGVRIRLTDNKALNQESVTDGSGVAEFKLAKPRQPYDPLLALASGPQGQFGVATNAWEQGIGSFDFGLGDGTQGGPFMGYTYTDRPIYRPGQTMHWKAIIRRDADANFTLPDPGQMVTVTIRDSMGTELWSQVRPLSPVGTLDGDFPLGVDAALGYYTINLALSQQVSFGAGFQVAEYRKPEYELTVAPQKQEYAQGDEIQVQVQANYFSGGPVSRAKVKWSVLASRYFFQWEPPADRAGRHYSFEDFEWEDSGRRPVAGGPLASGEGVTDANGAYTFTVKADIARLQGDQRLTFDVTITDPNNQPVSGQGYATVHKAMLYAGLSPQSYVAEQGEENVVDVVTVDWAGRPVANAELTVVANEATWYSVREQAEDGRYYWTSRMRKTPVYTATVTTDSRGEAVFRWQPPRPGQFKIEATGRGTGDQAARSATYVWVHGGDAVTWRQEDNNRMTLVAGKDEYRPGETAELVLANPFAGKVQALLTIERGTVLHHELMTIEGSSVVIHVPVRPEYVPNVYVSLIAVKGMDATNPLPSFRLGLARLNVPATDRKLEITITPDRKQAGPRDTVVWRVSARKADGSPAAGADISVAVVDKAVLALSQESQGTLFDRFYSKRMLGVRTATTLVINADRLVSRVQQGGKGGGGGGGGPAEIELRREFPDVAYWRASMKLDPNGSAAIEVPFPDNLTTWVMDARAITEDTLLGQARAEVVVSKELLLRPALPRFFVQGDRATIGATVQNNTGLPADVTVQLQAFGLALTGDPQATLRLPAGESGKVTWNVDVTGIPSQTGDPAEREAVVLLGASGGGQQDGVKMTLPVLRYASPDVVGTSGQVAPGDERLELVSLPAQAERDRGELTVRLEPSLAAGMTGGLSYLEHFPYECTEQTLSRFLPNLATAAALERLGIQRAGLRTALDEQVATGLQRLFGQQHLDGGWGWWRQDESNLAISAYVVYGLARAKQAGYAVDEQVLERAVRFLQRSLQPAREMKESELNTQAFVVYALAQAGQLEPNRAGALFEQRERLSLYGRAYLAMALHSINDDASATRVQTLVSDLAGRATRSATGAHWSETFTDYRNMNTDVRSSAIVLLALVQLRPEEKLLPDAVRWLMAARQGERWGTTQENAWAILALTEWMAQSGELEGSYRWEALLNGADWWKGTVTPAEVDKSILLRLDVAELVAGQTNGVTLRRAPQEQGVDKGQLYYTAHLATYVPAEKVAAQSRGLSISREYRQAECYNPVPQGLPWMPPSNQVNRDDPTACPAVTAAKAGDTITARLTLVVPAAASFVVVEDPLPAGLEAVDTSLRTTSLLAASPQVRKAAPEDQSQKPPHWSGWWWSPTHVELRDEKVVLFATSLAPGTYEFTYQLRAATAGQFLVMPVTAHEMYFPEVRGNSAGGKFTVNE